MAEYIEREAALAALCRDCSQMVPSDEREPCRYRFTGCMEYYNIFDLPAADVRIVPEGGIGEMSDGYHTFNGLYYQRMILFAALVKAHKDRAWKSHRHEDGELCFGGGWFIVGIDTPEGSYTYHYEDKDWDRFDCQELPTGKKWDGHTEADVTRLLSLPDVRPAVHGRWEREEDTYFGFTDVEHRCSQCGKSYSGQGFCAFHFCPNCGADMREDIENDKGN